LKAAWTAIREYPQAHMTLVNALEESLSATQILVIRGAAAPAARWATDLGKLYAPTRMIFAIPSDAELPPALAAKRPINEAVAYLCTGMTCSAPLTDFQEVLRSLQLRVN
jgi:hypothetical protein